MNLEVIKLGNKLKTIGYKDEKGNTFRLTEGYFFPIEKEDYKPLKQ